MELLTLALLSAQRCCMHTRACRGGCHRSSLLTDIPLGIHSCVLPGILCGITTTSLHHYWQICPVCPLDRCGAAAFHL